MSVNFQLDQKQIFEKRPARTLLGRTQLFVPRQIVMSSAARPRDLDPVLESEQERLTFKLYWRWVVLVGFGCLRSLRTRSSQED